MAEDFKPYLEVSEEVLIRFRTDLPGMSLLRDGLLELASNPRGLEDDDTWTAPRDAEELLVAMPSASGTRRSPEARLRANITTRRQEARRRNQEYERLALIVDRIEKELPDVVQAAREFVDGLFNPTDETVDDPAPGAAPPASSAPPVDVPSLPEPPEEPTA